MLQDSKTCFFAFKRAPISKQPHTNKPPSLLLTCGKLQYMREWEISDVNVSVAVRREEKEENDDEEVECCRK